MLKLKTIKVDTIPCDKGKVPSRSLNHRLLLHGHTNALSYSGFFDLLKQDSIPVKVR